MNKRANKNGAPRWRKLLIVKPTSLGDVVLAAPLVLDLVRFVAFEAARGGRGLQKQLAPFFKNPIGVDEHDFHAQFDALVDFYRNS